MAYTVILSCSVRSFFYFASILLFFLFSFFLSTLSAFYTYVVVFCFSLCIRSALSLLFSCIRSAFYFSVALFVFVFCVRSARFPCFYFFIFHVRRITLDYATMLPPNGSRYPRKEFCGDTGSVFFLLSPRAKFKVELAFSVSVG